MRTPSPVSAPAAEPEPAAPTVDLTFASVPADAEVFVDGVSMGRTPLLGQPVAAGTHTVRMVLGEHTIERAVRVGRHEPVRYVWRVADEEWEGGW